MKAMCAYMYISLFLRLCSHMSYVTCFVIFYCTDALPLVFSHYCDISVLDPNLSNSERVISDLFFVQSLRLSLFMLPVLFLFSSNKTSKCHFLNSKGFHAVLHETASLVSLPSVSILNLTMGVKPLA